MAEPVTWRDPKRYLWVLGLTMPLLPFLGVGLHVLTGWGVWLWIGPIVILGIVPLIDWAVGLDPGSPPDSLIKALEEDRYYRWLTWLFLPLQYAGFAFAFWYIATADLTVANKIGLAVTVGFIGGLGINTAHELGHKKESVERWLSKVALAQSAYGHFYIEHNRGHHVRVATPDDPASSRVGESFYRFWPRTVFGSLASAWRLESRRYARRGQHPFRIGNDILNAFLMTAAVWVVMVVWLGPAILPFLLLQAVVAFTLLEAVNYLEHYGMLRQRVTIARRDGAAVPNGQPGRDGAAVPDGQPGKERYERVEPRHSWNSNNIATNVLLYHLQRHSDHHAHPTRRYQALRDEKGAPALPTGYGGMILLALVPPLWSKLMDPRVAAHYDGDMSLANIQPGKRERIMRRFPAPQQQTATVVRTDDMPGAVLVAEGPIVARCPGCGYTYDERVGDSREGFPAGTPWSSIPDSWCCPDCGVRDKVDFVLA